jgi:hypothetical protein
MNVRQARIAGIPLATDLAPLVEIAPQLVLVFGSVKPLTAPGLLEILEEVFPQAELAGCTTAGEIGTGGVTDGEIVITALHFSQSRLRLAVTDLADMEDSRAAGRRLGRALAEPELVHVLVLGQGVQINGSALSRDLPTACQAGVMLSGGLAGDGGAFSRTWTLSRHGLSERQIVGDRLFGPPRPPASWLLPRWKPFGPVRKVTRCAGNVLYELDGQPALDIYKRYLGDYAKDLPASGLLFPFEMLGEDRSALGLIRTILGVNEAAGSLILAGNIVDCGYLRLMHASTDSLVDGAVAAAEEAFRPGTDAGESLVLLVSCVGRKLVMGTRVDEEVEAVAAVFGPQACIAGFYSNGEISPMRDLLTCHLHNQTMTITHIAEAAES